MADTTDEVGTTTGAASGDASVAASSGRPIVEGRSYIRTLGPPTVVRADGSEVELSRAQRSVLARLVLAAPQAVSWADLADAVWGQQRPASARASIQNQISRIRSAAGEDLIATDGDGYVLRVDTDLAILRSATSALEDLLLPAATSTRLAGSDAEAVTNSSAIARDPGDPLLEAAFQTLDRILTAAMPQVLAGFDAAGLAAPYRRDAETVVATARIVRLAAALSTGRWARAVIEGAQLHHESPLDEQVGANYARALALAGRRGEALSIVTGIRRELRVQLGVDPGPHLDAAEGEILHGHPGTGSAGEAGTGTFRNPPLAGRRTAIRRVLQAVAQRHPVRVQGEHGVGVSRMLFEIRTRLRALGVRAILVRAEEHPHSATSLVEELLAELGATRDTSISAISAFIAAASALDADHPTVFLVDDVQFLGPSAWQAIRAVAEAPSGGLVLGSHTDVVHLDGQVEVWIGPLDAGEVAMLARFWGIDDADIVARVFDASGGNPLAARLLAQSVRERPGDAVDPASAAGIPVLADFLHRLVGDLGTDRRQDLQLAAIAGDGYPEQAFDHVTWEHRPNPPADLVEVDGNGLLRFRHGAVRPYVYRTLPRGVRLDMHYALGLAARKSGAAAGTVARHLVAAAELDADAAVEAAREAAREAAKLGAYADGVDWLAQARRIDRGDRQASLDVAPERMARSISLDIEYADALRLAGDPRHLTELVSATEAALHTRDESLIAAAGFALLQLGGASPAGQPDDRIAAFADRVMAAITDPELRAPVQAAASLAWSMTGRPDTARALFDEAESAATRIATRLVVLPFAYLALGRPQDLPRREAVANELTDTARQVGEPAALWEGLHQQFTVHLQRGRGPAMRAALDEMRQLVGTIADVGRRWSVLYCAATVAELDGDFAGCESLAAQALSTFVTVSPDRAHAAYYGQLLPLYLRQGRLSELASTVRAMVSQQPGVTAWHAAAALVLADTPGHIEVRGDIARHLTAALDLAQDDFTWLAAHVVGGRAAAVIGDATLMDRYYDRLEPWAELVCWQGTCSYGPIADSLELIAHARGDDRGARHFRHIGTELRASLRAQTPGIEAG